MTDCEVKLTSERREEAPRLFTHINLHFVVTGKELKDAAVSRAVDLSAEVLLCGVNAGESGKNHPFV